MIWEKQTKYTTAKLELHSKAAAEKQSSNMR